MSYLLSEADHPEEPWAVLTGDSLFVSSAGRPDLLGEKFTRQLAEQQFHTLHDFYLNLPDHVMIYPNHGAGSPCGADIGARLSSTIGYERKFNNFLQFTDAKSFTDFAIKTAPPVPRYYPLMKKVNAEGPKVLGSLPRVHGLSPKAFKDAIDKKAGVLVDVRNMLAFGGGHIAGALNIAAMPPPRFSPFGPVGSSIQKSRFFSCLRRMTTLKKSSVYLFEPDTQNLPGI